MRNNASAYFSTGKKQRQGSFASPYGQRLLLQRLLLVLCLYVPTLFLVAFVPSLTIALSLVIGFSFLWSLVEMEFVAATLLYQSTLGGEIESEAQRFGQGMRRMAAGAIAFGIAMYGLAYWLFSFPLRDLPSGISLGDIVSAYEEFRVWKLVLMLAYAGNISFLTAAAAIVLRRHAR